MEILNGKIEVIEDKEERINISMNILIPNFVIFQVQSQTNSSEGAVSSLEEALSDRLVSFLNIQVPKRLWVIINNNFHLLEFPCLD